MTCQAVDIQGTKDVLCENTAVFRTEDDVPVCAACAALFRGQGFSVVPMGKVPECDRLDEEECLKCTEHSGTCPGVPD